MSDLTKRKLKSIDEMFSGIDMSSENEKVNNDVSNSEEIVQLPVYKCIPYHNHKFKIKRGNYEELVQSIKEFGVISPILVRPYEGDYEVVIGHRRHQGSIDAGKEFVPAIIKDLNDNEAWLIVSETNIHQSSLNEMSHSERAEVLHDYHEALKSQGKRNDMLDEVKKLLESADNEDSETSRHSGEKLDSCGEAGKEFKLSPRTVSRYLRIYYLNEELKVMLDENKIPVLAAVELSYLSEKNQMCLAEILEDSSFKMDVGKSKELRTLERKKALNEERIKEVLEGKHDVTKKKNSVLKGIKIKPKTMKKFFTAQQSIEEVEDIIDRALEMYYQQK